MLCFSSISLCFLLLYHQMVRNLASANSKQECAAQGETLERDFSVRERRKFLRLHVFKMIVDKHSNVLYTWAGSPFLETGKNNLSKQNCWCSLLFVTTFWNSTNFSSGINLIPDPPAPQGCVQSPLISTWNLSLGHQVCFLPKSWSSSLLSINWKVRRHFEGILLRPCVWCNDGQHEATWFSHGSRILCDVLSCLVVIV